MHAAGETYAAGSAPVANPCPSPSPEIGILPFLPEIRLFIGESYGHNRGGRQREIRCSHVFVSPRIIIERSMCGRRVVSTVADQVHNELDTDLLVGKRRN